MNIIKTWVRGASWRRTPRAADDGGSGPTRGAAGAALPSDREHPCPPPGRLGILGGLGR